MFKSFIFSSLLLSVSTAAVAELQISKEIRPQLKSVVNAGIERLPIPATPDNMILPEFGKGIIGWGAGPKDAEARLQSVNKVDVEKMQQDGVTLDMAQAWQTFYENETQRNPGNPTAAFRAQLMKKIVSLW